MIRRFASVATLALLSSCGGTPADAVRPPAPTGAEALGESGACRGSVGRAEPLVVDWRSNDRSNLELAMKDGVAVVAHECGKLQLLSECRLGGSYGFAGVSRKEEMIQLTSADEVRVNLPFSGSALGADVARGSSLDLALILVGRRTTPLTVAARADLEGSCEGATHFVRAAHVGAFALATGTKGKATAVASMFGVEAAGASESGRRALSKDGSLEACRGSKSDDKAPPDDCQAAVRLLLLPLLAERPAPKDAAGPPRDGKAPEPIETPCGQGYVYEGGKCARPIAEVAHLCAKDDPAGCEEQCRRGDAPSCHNLAALLAQGRYDLKQDPARAGSLFEKACAAGVTKACVAYATGDMLKDESARQRLFARACDAGDGDGCRSLGAQGLERGCALGHEGSCASLGEALATDRRSTKDVVKRGLEVLFKACLASTTGASCDRYVLLTLQDYGRGFGIPKDAQTGLQALERLCTLKYPTSAAACEDLGRRYEKGEDAPRDAARSAKWFGEACALEPGRCTGLATAVAAGAAPGGKARAAELFAKSCRAKGGGCPQAARMFERGEGVAKSPADAQEMFAEACPVDKTLCKDVLRLGAERCSRGDDRACGYLTSSAVYLRGSNDEARTKAVLTKGCEAKSARACEGALAFFDSPAMVTRACAAGYGDACFREAAAIDPRAGGKGDLAKARALYEQGCRAAVKSLKACETLAALLEKGEGGPKDVARAAQTYEAACVSKGETYTACFRAADLYAKGEGVPRDAARALRLYAARCAGDFYLGGDNCVKSAAALEPSAREVARDLHGMMCKAGMVGPWSESIHRPPCDAYARLGGDLRSLAAAPVAARK